MDSDTCRSPSVILSNVKFLFSIRKRKTFDFENIFCFLYFETKHPFGHSDEMFHFTRNATLHSTPNDFSVQKSR